MAELPGSAPDGSGHVPSFRELQLGRRVLELEKQKEDIAAELAQLKAKSEDAHTQSQRSSATEAGHPSSLTIPPELLPTFALLRDHISLLTRDNEALRYTFLGTTPRSPMEGDDLMTAAAAATGGAGGLHGINLEDVVVRVRELVKENEELGEMVLSAGRASADEWESALQDSRQVIASLDSDLSHQLSTIQSLRQEVEAYRSRYGPLGQDSGAGPQGVTLHAATRAATPSRRGRGERGHGRTNTLGSMKDMKDAKGRGGKETSPDKKEGVARRDSGRRGPGQGGRGGGQGGKRSGIERSEARRR